MAFVKLFSSITESSLWSESKDTRLLFVTMLAKADATGFVEASLPGLARVANLTIEETVTALKGLEGPDQHSKNPDHEGRRLVKMDGGWLILNYLTYRERRNDEERQAYMREYMRNRRAKEAGKPVNKRKQMLAAVSPREPQLSHAEAEAEAEEDTPAAAAAVVAPEIAPPGDGDGARQMVQGFNRRKIQAAVTSGDPLAVIGAAGGARDEQRDAEWLRDADGMSVGELVAVLWCAMHDRAAIRHPSGLRAKRAEWQTWPIEDRRGILRQAFGDLGIPIPAPRKPQAEGDGETRVSA